MKDIKPEAIVTADAIGDPLEYARGIDPLGLAFVRHETERGLGVNFQTKHHDIHLSMAPSDAEVTDEVDIENLEEPMHPLLEGVYRGGSAVVAVADRDDVLVHIRWATPLGEVAQRVEERDTELNPHAFAIRRSDEYKNAQERATDLGHGRLVLLNSTKDFAGPNEGAAVAGAVLLTKRLRVELEHHVFDTGPRYGGNQFRNPMERFMGAIASYGHELAAFSLDELGSLDTRRVQREFGYSLTDVLKRNNSSSPYTLLNHHIVPEVADHLNEMANGLRDINAGEAAY